MVECSYFEFRAETDQSRAIKKQTVRKSARLEAVRSLKQSISKSNLVQETQTLLSAPSALHTSSVAVDREVFSSITPLA